MDVRELGMTGQTIQHWETVPDADVAAWLSTNSQDARELIVEAQLPRRRVIVQKRADGRMAPVGIQSIAAEERAATLSQLYDFLSERLEVSPVLLKAAGAIAVRATSQQVRQFANHPLVKAIRPNRRLK